MGFKYVLVPCDTGYPMQEITFDRDITDLQDDNFRDELTKYFAACGRSVDREVLLEQLKERTGQDIKEKLASGEMHTEAVERLLASTSVEIFPVQLPTRETGWHGVSVYCDDKGVAKELEENSRVSGLVQACGYPAQTFRGDCFLGRVFDDTEDEWRRMDFPMEDCSSDASWVAQVKKQRENRSSSDMSSMAAKLGCGGAARIMPGMEDEAPGGDTEKYAWRQMEDEVEITFKTDGLTKGDKAQVKIAFSRQRLKVTVKGEVLMDAELAGPTTADENTWTLSDGVLQVTLSKASDGRWPSVEKV